ncbi:MAG: molybdopterin-guanine dinucleotide biosynthesis protein B [Dehalococcoidia bacterium]|nr:MAG: molybdopterin-guanine dinucleotide biosynthesis protein B [Dehalococcoidia bacterium]
MVPIIGVVGKSGVGKTYVIGKLVAELKSRGYRVATIKHSAHDVNLDLEGKDSWHHAQAGSDAVVISSPHRFAIIRTVDHDSSLAELSRFIGPDFDIVLAEGFKQNKVPKIEVHRKEMGSDLVSEQEELLAIVTDEMLEMDIPQYSTEDSRSLVDLIEGEYCTKEEKAAVSLYVNGEPVPLNDFVRNLISNVLIGLVASLKRIPQATGIDISVRKKDR